ncbi:lck-interacting transmembrane adapter 1 [Pogona vitticeps]
MAPAFAEWTAAGFFPAIFAMSLFAAACFLALCASCKRKDNNRMPAQDEELRDEAALLRQMELLPLRGSASNLPKLKRANFRGKNQSSAGVSVSYEDDGTVSSCSFIILPQRDLPQTPSEDPLPPEETYSNLTFPKRALEVFYESVKVKEEEPEETCVITEEAAGGVQADRPVEVAYARVLKGKQKKNHSRPEVGVSQEPCPGGTVLTPTVQVQDMYSVVCKNKRKTAHSCEGLGDERTSPMKASPGNCRRVSVGDEESGGRPGDWSPSSFESPVTEPCYESVRCRSWGDAGREKTTEPAYETVDILWENPRAKKKLKKKVPAENLYESIENLTFQCQHLNMASRFEL